MTVRELASQLGAPFEGEGDRAIARVAALEEAGPADLSFAGGKALKLAEASQAGCLLVPLDYANAASRTVIRVRDPRAAVAALIPLLHPEPVRPSGIHATAVIDPSAFVDPTATVGPHVVIGARARVGPGTQIGAGCVIGDGVEMGANCLLHPRVTVYRDTLMGDQVVLHSGVVIGADGFGFVLVQGAYQKFPQIGRVELGDRVEIGANSCVDRAALGVTSIGEGCKLDNMVHIGHNCRLGKHVIVVAQTGFAGGCTVGDYAVIGGQVGLGERVRIESRAILGSGSGVLSNKIVRAGEPQWGTPARPLKQYLAQLALVARLAKK